MTSDPLEKVKESWKDQPVQETGEYEYVVNPLTDQIPACSPELFESACDFLIQEGGFEEADVILGEEDRGGILVSHISVRTGVPFSLAKFYPSELEGEHDTGMSNGYTEGSIYVNGIEPGDRVIIVEDLVSTGSTLVNLVEILRDIGAEIVDIVTICQKPQFGGIEKVKEETGLEPKTGFSVVVEENETRIRGESE
ncbi:MAG: phosphoribosyltransferase family protein [Candidatus Nanohaloarchaea archaeon]